MVTEQKSDASNPHLVKTSVQNATPPSLHARSTFKQCLIVLIATSSMIINVSLLLCSFAQGCVRSFTNEARSQIQPPCLSLSPRSKKNGISNLHSSNGLYLHTRSVPYVLFDEMLRCFDVFIHLEHCLHSTPGNLPSLAHIRLSMTYCYS